MTETDFTKAFPPSDITKAHYRDGGFWYYNGEEWAYSEAPTWNPPCARNYMQGAYDDQVGPGSEPCPEVDRWETGYQAIGHMRWVTLDEAKEMYPSPPTLTKDPTDWERER